MIGDPAPRHPEHDAVSDEVRSWYRAPAPAIGLGVVRTEDGYLSDPAGGTGPRRFVMTVEDPGEVEPALEAAAAFYGAAPFEVWIDDRGRAERLTPVLAAAGMAPLGATVVLALVGAVRADRLAGRPSVEEVVDSSTLREWAVVKIRGFDDDEGQPNPERLEREVQARRSEWPLCRYQLARIDGEPVAVLGHYTGRDQMVFNLATRLPFRHRGIASSLLARWSEEAEEPPVRSRLINCDDRGPADELYRRLGFGDEVYWYRRFGPAG